MLYKKQFKITFLLFLLSLLFVILHNLVFTVFRVEEGVFFTLALFFIFAFFISLFSNLFSFLKSIFSYSRFIDPLLRDLRDFVLKFSEIKPGERVLDIGCGTGEQALFFAKKGAIVAGVDINPKMIGTALEKKKKEGLDAYFQGGDATDLPFLDPVFDVVLISLVLHEIDSKKRDKVISEMKRVAKKGGRLIFVDFNCPLPKSIFSFFVKLVEFSVGKRHYQNFKNYLKEGGLIKLLEKNNLKPEKIEYLKKGLLVAIKVKNL